MAGQAEKALYILEIHMFSSLPPHPSGKFAMKSIAHFAETPARCRAPKVSPAMVSNHESNLRY